MLGAGLIDGAASSTFMFSLGAVGSLIFASFVVYSMYYSNQARLRRLGSDPAKQVLKRHEMRDRRGDEAAVWTKKMTFRQPTD